MRDVLFFLNDASVRYNYIAKRGTCGSTIEYRVGYGTR